MLRAFAYFKGIRWRGSHIHVKTTGADIAIDWGFLKDAWAVLKIYIYCKFREVKQLLLRRQKAGTLAFYPDIPGPWYNIWQAGRLANLKTVSDITSADYIFIFEDKITAQYDKTVLKTITSHKLNYRIDDITKQHVADIFEAVFGYPLRIDPLTHTGPAIQKSNGNGKHDGIIIDCPIDSEDVVKGQTYQRLVDSTFNGKSSEDLRVAYVMGEIALVYHKHKPLNDRFGTDYLSVDVRDAADVFSSKEISLITEFCDTMGLDFGAVDVMRDKHDGRIYIVDVNKTGMPVLCLSLKTQIESQQKIADVLNNRLLRLS